MNSAKNRQDSPRFEFGKNWLEFVEHVDEARISSSVEALKEYLGLDSLQGKTFLDIGCGSGLSSLAARRLGAKVHSLDVDANSVACTKRLKEASNAGDPDWIIEEGSVLDGVYLKSLGQFDIVYSWGVLHHTGDMHRAFQNIPSLVKPGGLLHLAIYNDQGMASRLWRIVKYCYNVLPGGLRWILLLSSFVYLRSKNLLARLLSGALFKPQPKTGRGMSAWTDLKDWVGGYPFEVAKPEFVFETFKKHGFQLLKLRTCGGGLGCNEFVFRRDR